MNKPSDIFFTSSNLFPKDTWIIDTRAFIHVCNNLSLFPIHVKLSNGADIQTKIIFSKFLFLTNVFYIQSKLVHLLFVLSKDQTAYLLTKPVTPRLFQYLVSKFGMIHIHSSL